MQVPEAAYLDLILYSREQLVKVRAGVRRPLCRTIWEELELGCGAPAALVPPLHGRTPALAHSCVRHGRAGACPAQ